jgi:hypothetical protein
MCEAREQETIGYRVDRRQFHATDIILPSGQYLQALNPQGQKLEALLETVRPNSKPPRASSLFVFEALDCAEHFWTKMTNGKLYKVRVVGAVLHCGDMALTETLYRADLDAPGSTQLAEEYWRSGRSQHPVIELIVPTAEVLEVISDSEQDRRKAFAARAGIILPQPGRTPS